ncbi:hypothetical protein ABK040_007903 [Willaertia magna]
MQLNYSQEEEEDELKVELKQLIKEIEKEHQITILFVGDVGSRGFKWENPLTSDFDLSFIYTHHYKHYLTIQNKPQTIIKKTFINLSNKYLLSKASTFYNFNENNENNKKLIEFNLLGYDIKYALDLFYKSNRAIIFLLQTPSIYYINNNAIKLFKEKWIPICFKLTQRRALLHQMNHIVKYNIKRYILGCKLVRVKSYLYILHHLFYILYMYNIKDNNELFQSILPPLDFTILLNEINNLGFLNKKLYGQIICLMNLKVNSDQLEKKEYFTSGISFNNWKNIKNNSEINANTINENTTPSTTTSSNTSSKKKKKLQAEELVEEKEEVSPNDIFVGHSLELEVFAVLWYKTLAKWIWDLHRELLPGDLLDTILVEAIDLYEERNL